MKLLPHQIDLLSKTSDKNRVAYFADMGLGKTFIGSEKSMRLETRVILIVCQKSKINDWKEHYLNEYAIVSYDLTKTNEFNSFMLWASIPKYGVIVGIINYELAWRREDLLNLQDFTLMLDESSLIQNDKAKHSKFILKLKPSNVILLSGTPCSGRYQNLWSQGKLLGWDISKKLYESQYINYDLVDFGTGVKVRVVNKQNPYKNVERLKTKLREHGAVFLKTEDVIDLPKQNFIPIMVDKPKQYKELMKDSYTKIGDTEFIAMTSLTKRLYARQIASGYNKHKLEAVNDLIASTNDRLIIFYNFNQEYSALRKICEAHNRPISTVNGMVKDLSAFESESDAIALIQYQAGAMGLNLQIANKIIYFSLPERSELFEQSKKRIHRLGQETSCFYYLLMAKDSVDEAIYKALEQKRDFTDELFKECDTYRRREKL